MALKGSQQENRHHFGGPKRRATHIWEGSTGSSRFGMGKGKPHELDPFGRQMHEVENPPSKGTCLVSGMELTFPKETVMGVSFVS